MADILDEAQELYRESLDAMSDQRKQIEEDLEFSDPSDPQQWEPDLLRSRESDPGGRRPCLVMDQTGQYIANVAGQIEKQPPSIHAIPVSGGADKQAAEQLDGRFRHIEHASRAQQHYARTLTSAARAGVGYLIVRPEYVDRAMNWQEPRISSEPDPLKVVFDPWSTDTDGQDSGFGYLLSDVADREFARLWPQAEKRDFGSLDTRRSDVRKSVLLAEQWIKDEQAAVVFVWQGQDGEQSGDEAAYAQACQAVGTALPMRQYKDKKTIVRWRRMSGVDVLEESIYPADSIGIIPIYGYVGFKNGRMKYCGMARRARAPQQAYNYHISEQLAYIGTAPKAPYTLSKRAAAGVEAIWDNASREARGWLPFNDIDEDGAIAPPNRLSPSVSLVNHEAGAERALRDIQASLGMYQANLGAPSNETSGVAIENRKQQGEASTAHFPSHMSASLGQVGAIVMEMDSRLADTRRKQPIVGVDGSAGHVVVDPEQGTAFFRGPEGVVINPKVGKYGVRVVVGASYSTQRTQTNAAFGEIMRGNKELAPVVAPFWAQTLDFPGSDKFAQAMAAMAPPPVKAILQPEGQDSGPDPAKLAQELDQCKKALQEAIQHAHDAQKDADEAVAGEAEAKRVAEVRERELDIQAYNAETARLKVTGANDQQIQAIVSDMINTMLSRPEPLPGDQPPQQAMPERPIEQPQGAEEPMQEPMDPHGTPEPNPNPMEPQE